MLKNTIATIAFVTAVSAAPAIAAPAHGLTDFIGFGDSLSDKGRLPEAFATQPPQLGSRFSDGPTWMEILGQEFEDRGGANINLALGGATAGENTADRRAGYAFAESVVMRDPTNPDDIPFDELRSFATQINSFLTSGLADSVGSNPLVTVLLGGNDILGLPDSPTTADFTAVGTTIIGSIASGIQTLIAADSKFDNFLVSNLPSFTRAPSLFGAPAALTEPFDVAIETFNFALETQMGLLATATGTNIEIFDLYSAFDARYQEGLDMGLIADQACLEGGVNNCSVLGSSSQYLFLDDIHPNSFLQSGIASAALAQVGPNIAPIPLPATATLVLLGLGGLAAMRRRKAA